MTAGCYAVGDRVVLDFDHPDNADYRTPGTVYHHGIVTAVHDLRAVAGEPDFFGRPLPAWLLEVRWPGRWIPPCSPAELLPAPAEPCCWQDGCRAGHRYRVAAKGEA